MPYNSETETFYQAPATVVDSTPDGDTVQEGFDDRLTPAMQGVYDDINLLKTSGMIVVGIPATTTTRGIGRLATADDAAPGSTITDGPALLDAGTWKLTATPTAGAVPLAGADNKLPSGWVVDVGDYVFSHRASKDGYLPCNGAAVSRTTYAALFAVIGTRFGAGDGSTTFNIPNFAGRMMQGAWSNNQGAYIAAGVPNITACWGGLQTDEFYNGRIWGAAYAGSAYGSQAGTSQGFIAGDIGFNARNVNATYGNSDTVQPPSITANAFIKY